MSRALTLDSVDGDIIDSAEKREEDLFSLACRWVKSCP